ncbi:MAG: 23S rRNA (pseudouridine(1915)-N(3))-methyltransferase RlmH [Bacteroidetes bacterium GWF2_33_16]|nr:MAG: 23S rRNA (pseudouridine(1915)-N(3))-methyltransferase RlmH [Bacteroidetes bacterium GWE2_32_14]OFY05604.1 MAG: 23S rRNA (pseudouridine(1915)-N(3))-methyltransferase RlmH [Bacteroidetes bacterium GWF2_33_16]
MKVKLLCIGKTDAEFIVQGIREYEKRLKHYVSYESVYIPDVKNSKSLTENQQKDKEGELLKSYLKESDFVVLLDERGKDYSSVEFSKFIEKHMISGLKSLVFIIGGPYGFSKDIVELSNAKISLSKMTFSHQMVRMIFVEQLYRAMTIIKGEPYHHQ